MDNTPLILTGPPGSGKSHWIQEHAAKNKLQLFVCPCRKDRTLRDGRQKLHIWARRTEPAILWLEGADDLTPEAQAFLRRILETHAPEIQFVLECRDAGKLQEPIRSRCSLRRVALPSPPEKDIADFLTPNEYSFRRFQQCDFLKKEYPDIWESLVAHRKEENAVDLVAADLPAYIERAYNPDKLIQKLLPGNIALIGKYARCVDNAGSLWAFLGTTLYSAL